MKTVKRIYLVVVLVVMLVGQGHVFAQVQPEAQRGIPMPQAISDLLWQGLVDSAIVEFEVFKKQQTKADPYHLLYVEMTFYRDAQMADVANAESYKAKYDALYQQILKKYPERSDTYLLQITPESTPERIIELTTKAIKADPTNWGAYQMRSGALYQLGRNKEAAADVRKAQGL